MPDRAFTAKKLGRYDITRVLGKGAMGVVYEARDPNLNRRVAIKTVRVDSLGKAEAAEYELRFRTEAHSAARLQHPNIVSVYDSDRDGDTPFLVMEFVKGEDLKHYLDIGQRYSLEQSVRMMRDLLAALDYAHQNKIIHRDIKPANMIIEDDGRVKLTDFGVARIQDSGEATRTQGGMVGTLKYMSPEQVEGQSVGAASDIFSAGVVLYQLLTDRRPFDGESYFSIIQQITTQNPPAPSSVNPMLPPALDAVVARALAKDKTQRFTSAQDFSSALQAAARRADPTITPSANPFKTIEQHNTSAHERSGSTASISSSSVSGASMSGGSTITQELELVYWKDVKESNDVHDLEGFLKRFPEGVYADLAKRRLKRIADAKAGQGLSPYDSTQTTPNAMPPASQESIELADDITMLYRSHDRKPASKGADPTFPLPMTPMPGSEPAPVVAAPVVAAPVVAAPIAAPVPPVVAAPAVVPAPAVSPAPAVPPAPVSAPSPAFTASAPAPLTPAVPPAAASAVTPPKPGLAIPAKPVLEDDLETTSPLKAATTPTPASAPAPAVQAAVPAKPQPPKPAPDDEELPENMTTVILPKPVVLKAPGSQSSNSGTPSRPAPLTAQATASAAALTAAPAIVVPPSRPAPLAASSPAPLTPAAEPAPAIATLHAADADADAVITASAVPAAKQGSKAGMLVGIAVIAAAAIGAWLWMGSGKAPDSSLAANSASTPALAASAALPTTPEASPTQALPTLTSTPMLSTISETVTAATTARPSQSSVTLSVTATSTSTSPTATMTAKMLARLAASAAKANAKTVTVADPAPLSTTNPPISGLTSSPGQASSAALPAPAPAAAPAVAVPRAADSAAAGPREACASRGTFGMVSCLTDQCSKSIFQNHPVCVERREQEEQRRNSGSSQ